MGIEFDRVMEGFDGPFEMVSDIIEAPPAGVVASADGARGYVVDHINDAFVAVNRTLAAGDEAWWYTDEITAGGQAFPAGAFYLEADRDLIQQLADEKGLNFVGVRDRPSGNAMQLEPVKIALWDQYGGSMPSGWTRMILEDFEFDFDVLFPPDFDQGDLDEYDVLLFDDGAIPAVDGGGRVGFFGNRGPDPATVPDEYRSRMGRMTAEVSIPPILDFVREGGAAIAIGSSANLAYHAGLPVQNHLMEDGRPLSREQYFTPGSVLDMKVEHVSPLTHGFDGRTDVLFSHSPTFSLAAGAEAQGVRTIGWYDTANPLRSGWAWGERYLENGVGALEADYGQGKIFIFGPKITFRAQSHGTFGFLFNSVYYGATDDRPMS